MTHHKATAVSGREPLNTWRRQLIRGYWLANFHLTPELLENERIIPILCELDDEVYSEPNTKDPLWPRFSFSMNANSISRVTNSDAGGELSA
jgi:hypothetical protein